MSNASFADVKVISVKSQVVAGTNYSVKYKTTDSSGVETFLLAKIFVPLPYANKPPEVMTTLYGVGEDSPLDMILKVQRGNEANELLDELVGGTVDFVAEKVVGSIMENESEDSNELLGSLIGGTIDYVATTSVGKIFKNDEE